jgi:hypothetical protein
MRNAQLTSTTGSTNTLDLINPFSANPSWILRRTPPERCGADQDHTAREKLCKAEDVS